MPDWAARGQGKLLGSRHSLSTAILAGVLMVIAALFYLQAMDSLSTHAVIATILGVFFSVLLGSGLFSLSFFSDKSGHDDEVSGTTTRRDD